MKRVLLFGPSGTVGRNLSAVLEESEYQVYYWKRDQYEVSAPNIDVFIYIAGITSARQEKTEKYVIDNCYMAARVVEQCRKYHVSRIIYLSSDEVYGKLNTDFLTEDSERIDPNAYAMTKYLSEQILLESGIPCYIIRSPGIVDGKFLGKSFLERTALKMAQGEEIVCSHLDETFNNVVHVEDLSRFILLLTGEDSDKENQIFLVGQNGKERLCDILGYMKEKLGSNSEIIPNEEGGRHFVLPTEKAQNRGYISRGIYPIIDEIISMLDSRILGKDVEFVKSAVYKVDTEQVKRMKRKAQQSQAHKFRVCVHENIKDKMHVMFSVYPEYAYVRPHFHPEKAELKVIVEGRMLVILYDHEGHETERMVLSKGEVEMVHIKQGIAHTNIPLTDCVLLEITPGPFNRAKDNIFIGTYPENMEKNEVKKLFIEEEK